MIVVPLLEYFIAFDTKLNKIQQIMFLSEVIDESRALS